jgi:hypothetical protein
MSTFDNLSDDELVALNQKLGLEADNIREQRIDINNELKARREKAKVAAILKEAQDRIDAVAPGALIVVNTSTEAGSVS